MNELEKKALRKIRDTINALLGEGQPELPLEQAEKPAAAKGSPVHQRLIKEYENWHLREHKTEFIWSTKDAVAIKKLKAGLIAVAKNHRRVLDDDGVVTLFQHLLLSLKDTDEWVYENASPSVILSKFNQIIAKLMKKADNDNKIDVRLL